MKKRVFVVWAKSATKYSDFLARAIHAEMIVSFKENSRCVLLRYLIQALDTYKKLCHSRPEIIFVQNPPVFATLVVYIFCKFNNARYIIDTHTAGFLDTKWKVFHFLHKFLARRALFSTVHNFKNLEIIKAWGIEDSKTMQFYQPTKDELVDLNYKLDAEITENLARYSLKVFMVNRFASDDAYWEVIETARIMPETGFLITGDESKLKSKDNLPSNVILTGLIEHREFMRLMEISDVVLSLTKRPDTLLGSVREAMALEKPIVTSDTEVLRHYYGNFAVFTDNTPTSLREKILQAQENKIKIQDEIKKSIVADRKKWNSDLAELEEIIEK